MNPSSPPSHGRASPIPKPWISVDCELEEGNTHAVWTCLPWFSTKPTPSPHFQQDSAELFVYKSQLDGLSLGFDFSTKERGFSLRFRLWGRETIECGCFCPILGRERWNREWNREQTAGEILKVGVQFWRFCVWFLCFVVGFLVHFVASIRFQLCCVLLSVLCHCFFIFSGAGGEGGRWRTILIKIKNSNGRFVIGAGTWLRTYLDRRGEFWIKRISRIFLKFWFNYLFFLTFWFNYR